MASKTCSRHKVICLPTQLIEHQSRLFYMANPIDDKRELLMQQVRATSALTKFALSNVDLPMISNVQQVAPNVQVLAPCNADKHNNT